MLVDGSNLVDLSVIVPTYNEHQTLVSLVEQTSAVCQAHGLSHEIVVVDDNSPDGTGMLAEALADRWPVRVVHRAAKLGLTSAVLAGCAVANGDLVIVMDADLSHPPHVLPRLVEAMRSLDADIVVASRYVPGGRTRAWPRTRQMMSRLACWAARPLTPVRDATSGFFLVRRERLARLHTSTAGFKVGLEVLVRTGSASIAELPYTFSNRITGYSKMSAAEVLRYGRQLVRLLAYTLRHRGERNHPRYRVLPLAEPFKLDDDLARATDASRVTV